MQRVAITCVLTLYLPVKEKPLYGGLLLPVMVSLDVALREDTLYRGYSWSTFERETPKEQVVITSSGNF